jgi:hypothetical protein
LLKEEFVEHLKINEDIGRFLFIGEGLSGESNSPVHKPRAFLKLFLLLVDLKVLGENVFPRKQHLFMLGKIDFTTIENMILTIL